MKFNIKTGFYGGIVLGFLLVGLAFFTFQKITDKAENISQINLHQLEYYNMKEEKVKLSDYKGKKILINFWATWCLPCIGEFPVLQETYQMLKDDYVFLMVSDQSIDKINAFANNKGYDFIYLKTDNLLLEGISTVPQSFILNEEGELVHHHSSIFEGEASVIIDSLNIWTKN